MNAESIALLIDDTNRFELNLAGFLVNFQGNIDQTRYETFEEQVTEIRKALGELKDFLLNLEVEIQ